MKLVVLERNTVGTDIDVSSFEQFGEVTYYKNTVKEEVEAHVGDAEIIIANKAPINEDTIGNCPNVKMVCEFATGFDNVDLAYCKKRGIAVTNVVDYCTDSVAQHTFAMALFLFEKLHYYDNYVKSGAYGAQDKFSNFDRRFGELNGRTWGIIGLGNIGKKVAHIAKAFGCRVIYYSVTGKNTCSDYENVSLDELLKESDVLSIHCPLSDLTKNLIDREALCKMKQSAILINVARGAVVNNADLAWALNENIIEGAGLDVLDGEPIRKENPLNEIKDSEKLIITPHMAWGSVEARTRIVEAACENIRAFLNGEIRSRVDI